MTRVSLFTLISTVSLLAATTARAQVEITDVRTRAHHRAGGVPLGMPNAGPSVVVDTFSFRPTTPTTPPTPTNGAHLTWVGSPNASVSGDGNWAGMASVSCNTLGLAIHCQIDAIGQILDGSGGSGRSAARVGLAATNVLGNSTGTTRTGNGYGWQVSGPYTTSFPNSPTLSLNAQGSGVCNTDAQGNVLCAGSRRGEYQIGADLYPTSTTVGTTGTISISVALPTIGQTMTVSARWIVAP